MSDGDVAVRLVDAAIAVLGSDRPAAMPLREVAKRAGVTTGSIQHHFGSKNALVLAALGRHGEQFTQRLEERRGPVAPPPPGIARAILHELLPLDDNRHAEARVAAAFELLAASDPGLAASYREQYTALVGLLRTHLPGSSVQDAEILLAAIGGLRTDLLLGRLSGDGAVALVDLLLDRLTDRLDPG